MADARKRGKESTSQEQEQRKSWVFHPNMTFLISPFTSPHLKLHLISPHLTSSHLTSPHLTHLTTHLLSFSSLTSPHSPHLSPHLTHLLTHLTNSNLIYSNTGHWWTPLSFYTLELGRGPQSGGSGPSSPDSDYDYDDSGTEDGLPSLMTLEGICVTVTLLLALGGADA
jgi:hypothetical protein